MSKSKTTEQFKQEVFDLVGDEYEVLDEYKRNNIKISIKHNKCGYEYLVAPIYFLSGKRCPKCYGTPKKTTEQFKQEVFDLVGDEYEVLGKYTNTKTKILIKHKTCDYRYKVKPYHFLHNNRRCPKCSIKNKPQCNSKTTKEFKQEVFDLVGDEYEVLDEYKTNKIKIKMKHKKCGNVYEVKPNNFQQGDRCPFCKRSKGEEIIASLLNKWKINYISQVTFSDCKYKRILSYDFQIFLKDETFILLEYNGKQHYENTFGYQENFKFQKIRDKIKQEYCKKKGIPFYVIRYDEDIEKVLRKILFKEL